MSTDKTLAAKAARFSFIGLSGAVLAIAALLSGCNKKEPATPAQQSSPATEVKIEARKAADETKKIGEDVKDAAEKAGEKIEEGAKKAVDATKDAAEDVKNAVK